MDLVHFELGEKSQKTFDISVFLSKSFEDPIQCTYNVKKFCQQHFSRFFTAWSQNILGGKRTWGENRMARGGIRLVHGHTKSTLITYFSGVKIDPKYAFLHAFFLICPSSFPKFVYMTKSTPLLPIMYVFAPLNDVRAYSAWS